MENKEQNTPNTPKASLSKPDSVFLKMAKDLWVELISPSLKNLLSNLIKNGSDYLIYRKDIKSNNQGRFSNGGNYTNYSFQNYSNNNGYTNYNFSNNNQQINSINWKKATVSDYNSVNFNNPTEARNLLQALTSKIEATGMVSVAEMYDALDIPFDYVTNDYGWTSLRTASVYLSNGKWYIKFPKPISFKSI